MKKQGTGKEDLKAALGILKNVAGREAGKITKKAQAAFQKISQEAQNILVTITDPKERFNRAVRAQRDALVEAGLSQDQAGKMAAELVVEALKDSNSEKGER